MKKFAEPGYEIVFLHVNITIEIKTELMVENVKTLIALTNIESQFHCLMLNR